jgi:hypothetical protein
MRFGLFELQFVHGWFWAKKSRPFAACCIGRDQ